MKKLRFVQLPVPPPSALAATGNVPLAAGCLGVAAGVHGFGDRVAVDVVTPGITDRFGDTRLADFIAADEPDFVGLSLYLWNVERSLHLAREIKRRSPRTKIILGGPEVSVDNTRVLDQPGFDIAVAGEGEEALADILDRTLTGREVAGLPGVAIRTATGLSAFGPPRAASFKLAKYPSPYLEGLVPVEAERSVYVEGARGCRSKCTFCFYPKAQSQLRLLDAGQVEALVGGLRDRGAREVAFLDPTFNHRPDFEPVLEALVRANPSRELSFFAEVRPEGLKPEHAKLLKRAGFNKLEIGLQSVNAKTLKRVQRGGNPAMVAAAAKLMRDEGIDLLVDLIVGLPGDDADDVARGVDFLEKHGLGDCAQVFALFVLPGTAMRDTAVADGLIYEPEPPYRIIRTATMSEQAIAESLAAAEARLGRSLDEQVRPHLVDAEARSRLPDVFRLRLDRLSTRDRDAAARAGAQHCALWFEGEDLFAQRAEIVRAIAARQAVDPYATLDVVLAPTEPFPLDLLQVVQGQLERASQWYATRALRHRNAPPRISVVLRPGVDAPADWVEALREARVEVFADQPVRRALANAEQLGNELPAARVIGAVTDAELRKLAKLAAPEWVVFADRDRETTWQRQTLGLGDTN